MQDNPEVLEVINTYPNPVKEKILVLRQLIIETANSLEDKSELQETLKWGEPSYLAEQGSTVRIAWKASKPDQYGIYFHCKTRLVDTFKELYGDKFKFEGNRAIIFSVDNEVPQAELQHCILLSLKYHRIKHQPLLGA